MLLLVQSPTEEYVSKKVKSWCDKILTLSTIAKTHPHSAYDAFVHNVLHKWNYVIESVGSPWRMSYINISLLL